MLDTTLLVWLVFLKSVFHNVDLPTLAVRSNAIWMCLTGIASFKFVSRVTSTSIFGAIVGAAIMGSRQLLIISAGGMEPLMFTSLAVFAFWAAANGKAWQFGTLAGLAILTRLEGFCLVPIGLICFCQSKGALVAFWTPLVVLLASWIVPATMYYGSPIPHSIVAKSHPLYLIPPLTAFWGTVFHFGNAISYANGPIGGVVAKLVSFFSLSSISLFFSSRLRQLVAYAPGLVFAELLVLYGIGNPVLFEWYVPLVVIFPLLGITFGCFFAASFLYAQAAKRPVVMRPALNTLYCVNIADGGNPRQDCHWTGFTWPAVVECRVTT